MLIHKKLKFYQSGVVVVVMFNVFRPKFAHNVDQYSVSRIVEFHHYQRRPVSFLNQKRIVVNRKSILWLIGDDAYILPVDIVLAKIIKY